MDNVVIEPIRLKGYTSGPRIGQPVPMNRVRNYDDAFSDSKASAAHTGEKAVAEASAAHAGDKAVAEASAAQAGLKFDTKFNT